MLSDSWDPFSPTFDPGTYAKGKSHFQITFLFVTSRKRRQALTDFYAFCRLADDISDQRGLSESRRASLLKSLSDWVRTEQPIGHKFWDRLLMARQTYSIPNSSLLGIIDGVAMDLGTSLEIQTWAELNSYVYGVACCVGEAVLCILGAAGETAAPYSLAMGRCLQYLNIMRDIEEDFSNSRVYVPREFLNGRDLRSCTPEAREELYGRALNFRVEARPYSWRCLPAELMAAIYLEGARKYWRSGIPRRLSRLEKLRIMLKRLLQPASSTN